MTTQRTLWKATALALIAFGVVALGGCGGGAGKAAPAGPSGPAVTADYYVDPMGGLDANPGTWEAPFKTLTHALSVAVAHETIHATPGIYSLTTGEDFPLLVPDLVTLVGDTTHQGVGSTATTRMEGSFSLRYRPQPVTVPPVPTPATNASTRPSVSRQISSPVVR